MNLTSDQQVLLATRFYQTQRDHRYHLDDDDPDVAGIQADHAQLGQQAKISPLGKAYWKSSSPGMEKQIQEVSWTEPEKYLSFLGTLFLFVATASLCTIIPGYKPPTGSLSTTAALALCVFVAVPLYGIREQGLLGYSRTLHQPTIIMLPFDMISELSRTLALAVRLFGNMMSGVMIIGILLTITPFVFPIFMTALGLLTGMVQAYIFSILAAVYIAAATRVPKRKADLKPQPKDVDLPPVHSQ